MQVRPTVPDDAGAVARVHVASWRGAYAGLVPEHVLRELSVVDRAARHRARLAAAEPGSCHLVAVDGETVVGFAGAGPARDGDLDPASTGEVYALYVEPAYWSTGTGRALLDAASGQLVAAGFGRAVLWVLAGNLRARRFYERGGFTSDGARQVLDMGAPVPEVRYERVLP